MTGDKVNGITQGLDLASASDIAKFAAYSGAQGATQAGLSTLLQGGGLNENLNQALVSQLQSTLQAIAFNAVGDFSQSQNWPESGPEKVALHALVGGLVSEAGGGSFATGALAAGANEALVTSLAHAVEGNPALLLAASQLVGIAAAGATEGDVQKGAEIAKNATAYNYLNHHEVDDLVKDLKGCRGAENPAACRADLTLKYEGISDQKSGMDLMHCTDVASCDAQRSLIAVGNAALDKYESSGALNWEERLIVRGFLDSNQDDMRLAVQKTLQGTHAEIAGMLPGVGLVVGKGGTSAVGSVGAKGMQSIIEPKIAQQMGKRGWTTDSLESVIANPSKTVVTKDTRFDPVSGTRLNDPATGYVAKDGSYVVRNDRTGAIVQVSDKNDKNWVAPWE
ncbi:hypothetical protein ACVWXD_002525 [Pseudomonas sp. TE3911]